MKSLIKKIVVSILTWEAKMILKRHKPFIISITGNLGKTTTKDSIAAALKTFDVRATAKSLNSEFGLPLTIIGSKSGWSNVLVWVKIILQGMWVLLKSNYPKYLVLEIGADQKGDIETVSKWLKSDIVVLTAFSEVPVHVENYTDKDELVKEKAFLVDTLKTDGLFIYNADCKDSLRIVETIRDRKIKLVSFGIKSGDVKVLDVNNDISTKSVSCTVRGFQGDYILTCTNTVGESAILCALPALIVANDLSLDIVIAIKNIIHMKKTPGRMSLLDGKSATVIIDDSYNASPLATSHGIKTLASLTGVNKKIAMLGDMLELGDYTRDEHYKIGLLAAKSMHTLVTVGPRSKAILEGALDAGMREANMFNFDTSIDAARYVLTVMSHGDVIYIKGSQSMRMERAVKMLLSDAVDSKTHLVRQEEEWLKR